jgi:hypothetical protein
MSTKLTSEQLHILQHSLGCDGHGRTEYRGGDEGDGCFNYHRNRFMTDAGRGDGVTCDELVKLGLMKDHGPQKMAGGMHCYSVTVEGVCAMKEQSPPPPKLTPGQQRYRAFLRADLGCSFGEFLRLKRA